MGVICGEKRIGFLLSGDGAKGFSVNPFLSVAAKRAADHMMWRAIVAPRRLRAG